MIYVFYLLFNASNGQIYNVGSDHAVSIFELAHVIRDLLSPDKEILVLGQNNSTPHRNCYVPNIEKIYHHFGLKPRYSLVESILHTVKQS